MDPMALDWNIVYEGERISTAKLAEKANLA